MCWQYNIRDKEMEPTRVNLLTWFDVKTITWVTSFTESKRSFIFVSFKKSQRNIYGIKNMVAQSTLDEKGYLGDK